MGNLERFNLRWGGFEANIKVALREVRDERELSDVTLVAGDGKQVKANKVILACGSSFFFNILRENPHPHPLIYLKGVSHGQLLSLLDFLYTGEASIVQEDLNEFMDIADDLKVKGLTSRRSQTKSNPSTSAPLQSQGAAEEPGPLPRVSYPHSTTSTTPASIQNQEAAKEAVTSHPHQSQFFTAAESDTKPNLNVISALRVATEELVCSAKASRPLSMGDSDHDNAFPQATYKENHVSTNNIKVEVNDCEPFIRQVSNISNAENVGGNFVNNQRIEEMYQGMGLSDKREQNDPKEEVIDSSTDMVITETVYTKDLNYDEDSNRMRPAEPEEYEYFDLGNTMVHFDDKQEIEDSNCDMDATEVVDNVFINEHSTHACDERSKENGDDMMPDGGQDMNSKTCDICAKTFDTLYKLQRHKMSHDGEKFECLVCFKKFPNKSSLNLHEKIHTGEKFQCLVCFKRFSRMETLKMHNGLHTGEKPYPCLHCYKKFSRRGLLDMHVRTHTGEQPYQCLVCWKKFSQLGNLKKHEKIHSSDNREKPFQCVVCSKQFSYESSFQKHKLIHTNEKPFK